MPDKELLSATEVALHEQIKCLKNKRAFLKRNLTILQNYLDEADSGPDRTNKISEQLEVCERATNSFNLFIEDVYDSDYERLFDNIFDEKAITDALFSKLKTKFNSIFHIAQGNVNLRNVQSTSPQTVRLPRINLISFSGKYEDWLSFKDSFNSLIDNNNSLSKIEKFQYLKGALIGEAAAVIKCLEISDNNYEEAKDLLKNRFENTRVIICNHVRGFFELPALNKESHVAFRNMLDTILQHTRALKAMGRPVDNWDDILIYLIVSKFPFPTRKEWEDKCSISELPTLKTLTDFLLHKCHTLESIQFKDNSYDQNKSNKISLKNANCHIHTNKLENKITHCNFCNKNDHFTNQCKDLLKLAIKARIESLYSKYLCLNCLRTGHKTKDCRSSRCKKCSKLHNTILHLSNDSEIDNNATKSSHLENSNEINEASSLQVSNFQHLPSNIILSTCVVEIKDCRGNFHNARAILDSGSQIHIISKRLLNDLGLNASKINLSISGINNNYTQSSFNTKATIKSKNSKFSIDLNFCVLERVTNYSSVLSFNQLELKLPKNIMLADPEVFNSREIDLLIGAEIFYDVLTEGIIKTPHKGLLLKNSVFGWLISGVLPTDLNNKSASCNLNTLQDLSNKVSAFWEMEQLSTEQIKSMEEQECERHFEKTISRDKEGRFIASFPWKLNPNVLGDSFCTAKKRFLNLERKLIENTEAKSEYDKFLREYLGLNHMRELGTLENADLSGYFLPHHAVYKADSLTTKTRVVFDASAKTTSRVSLNDCLMTGPVIQSDLFSILIRFRFYKFVLTADISKMYRQILINSQETKYQKILYRFDELEPLKVYELSTLTYGTRPASYIATRCLKELSSLIRENEPRVSQIIADDFYVDDLITGGDDVQDLKIIRERLTSVLIQGGFPLVKWASNNSNILGEPNLTYTQNLILSHNDHDHLKTLGVCWTPINDFIQYNTHLKEKTLVPTKRFILANIAQIFDPLGLLCPIIVIAKLIMQDLWKIKIGWDQELPLELHNRWLQFSNQLSDISKITIPRRVIANTNSILQLHGFADASQIAFGACIYVREILPDQNVRCQLLCAKSRVAPLKTLTVPRLELSAAVLLTDLMLKVLKLSRINFSEICYYSDSTITLSWINGCPSKWKTFISHRVADIQGKSSITSWFHVRTNENPADIISRGLLPAQLYLNHMWWNGPDFLYDIDFVPSEFKSREDVPEAKTLISSTKGSAQQFSQDIFNRFSSIATLVRVTAYCKRFVDNSRNKTNKRLNSLSLEEINNAEMALIKIVQREAFGEDIRLLQKTGELLSTSKILSLNPFLENGILRVGGRLRHSNLSFSKKFPILLPRNHPFTDLVIRNEHIKSLHAGTQGTLSLTRLRYWPIHGRNATQKIIRKCVICFKNKPHKFEYKMADLPASRLQISRPFSKTGLDYFGPFLIKDGSKRSKKLIKVYGCVFICILTKAVHCEIVEDLTTEAFIATLKRFTSRRGLISEIFCDNATNFVGARNEFRNIYNFLKNAQNYETISNKLSEYHIKWNFNPPRAPHFGGLWEAAVKSFKRHIYKIAGNANLTLLELYTLFTEVESILNSRPLTPISPDPNDLNYLTPGHFLIGDNLKAIPEVDLINKPSNRLSRWQRTQQLQQQFWRRWSRDYLQELQKRHKWQSSGGTLSKGQLVVIEEENTPPRRWQIGRVMETYPGPDQVVRAAKIKTAVGEVKRPSVRLCVLPIEQ